MAVENGHLKFVGQSTISSRDFDKIENENYSIMDQSVCVCVCVCIFGARMVWK
jgi:hypothetical protein